MVDSDSYLQSLISIAKVFPLQKFEYLPMHIWRYLCQADQQKRHLTDSEILDISKVYRSSSSEVIFIKSISSECIQKAKSGLFTQCPYLFKKGGALSTQERSQACWRDCENFYRVIVYAVAINHPHFTEEKSIEALKELYKLLKVPSDGLQCALVELKASVCERFERANGETLTLQTLKLAFEHLDSALFKSDC